MGSCNQWDKVIQYLFFNHHMITPIVLFVYGIQVSRHFYLIMKLFTVNIFIVCDDDIKTKLKCVHHCYMFVSLLHTRKIILCANNKLFI